MNLLAHMAVARAVRDEAPYLLGAALPDLASPVRCRLTEPSGVDALDAGIRLHHRTDAVFHGLGWFLDLQASIGSALRDRGVGRGPSRAAAHVGIELLLDGALESDEHLGAAADDALRALETHRVAVESMAAAGTEQRWSGQLDRIVGHARPRDGMDADLVAARLERICARRPRLAFAEGDRAIVSDVLEGVADEVDAAADNVVLAVLEGL